MYLLRPPSPPTNETPIVSRLFLRRNDCVVNVHRYKERIALYKRTIGVLKKKNKKNALEALDVIQI